MSSNVRSDSGRRNARARLRLVVDNHARRTDTAAAFSDLTDALLAKAVRDGTLHPNVNAYYTAAGWTL